MVIVGIGIGFLIFAALLFCDFPKDKHEQDDGKPIKNIRNMQIHCDVVSERNDFYWRTGLECAVCAYREECKKYVKRYGRLPNGRK